MENMQDKEFDQFFKNKLAGAEMDPPAMMWNKIEQEMKPAPKKAGLPFLWMAAAAAAVVITAGVLFNKQEKIQLRGEAELVQNLEAPVTTSPMPLAAQTEEVVKPQGQSASAAVSTETSKKSLLAMQPISQSPRLSDNKPVANMVENQEPATALKVEELPDSKEAYAVTLNDPVTPEATEVALNAETQENRRGIRNVGDLVNFVVDKVDKREEKLLEFHTDDDDQSSLVAINIGFLKLNTKNRAKR